MAARFKLMLCAIQKFLDHTIMERQRGVEQLSAFAEVLLKEAIHQIEMVMLLVLPSFWGRSRSSAAVTLNMDDDDENDEEDEENVMYYASIVEELVPLFEHVVALGMYDVSIDEVFVDIMRYWDAHM